MQQVSFIIRKLPIYSTYFFLQKFETSCRVYSRVFLAILKKKRRNYNFNRHYTRILMSKQFDSGQSQTEFSVMYRLREFLLLRVRMYIKIKRIFTLSDSLPQFSLY